MSLTIPVAHDFICPWCWVGFFQAIRLKNEFDVSIEWLGYELLPAGMVNEPSAPKIEPLNKPAILSRFALLMAAENMVLPLVPKPPNVRTFNAHQAVEYAKTEGVQDALVEAIYRAFWEDGRDINKIDNLCEIATGIVSDLANMRTAMETDQFGDQVVDFDDDAYSKGVYNVPTFFVGEKRLAEQPYSVIRKAMVELIGSEPETALYKEITFNNTHSNRPYTFINMVSTIDGKIITGERNESVNDLGSDVDHMLMHRLEAKADAVLVGANSLSASGVSWNPKTHTRIVVTRSGNVPLDSQFLQNGDAIILTTEDSNIEAVGGISVIRAGKTELDWHSAMKQLLERGINVVNILGGSEINAQLLEREMIDEIFMTLAPKIKLGSDTPTIAGGTPLKREDVQKFILVSHEAVGEEIFLRYRK
jgi:riboflavin biosynthesis pyrimidine reductase/predicted DsbA family dithiol-disulfide isomerase